MALLGHQQMHMVVVDWRQEYVPGMGGINWTANFRSGTVLDQPSCPAKLV